MESGSAEATARRPTIADVARRAGVAIGTASDALNGKGRVAEGTRARVREAARSLDYRPDAGARGLVTGRAMAIGVRVGRGPVIPEASFFIELLNGAAARAADAGYSIVISTSELRHAGLVDALIAVDPLGRGEVQDALDANLPVVTVGRVPRDELATPSVDTDHGRSISLLLGHLASTARPGAAWLLSLEDRSSFVGDVEAAFSRWCVRAEREARILTAPEQPEAVERAVAEAIAHAGPPAILVSAFDRPAVWSVQALKAAGVAIPGDTVVGAATDGDVLRVAQPSITALDLDGGAHGRAAVDLALQAITEGEVAPQTILLPARLVERESSAALAASGSD